MASSERNTLCQNQGMRRPRKKSLHRVKDQELAEKRRLAPGWLDREEKILQPERTSEMGVSHPSIARAGSANIMDQLDEHEAVENGQDATIRPAGDELDRAFGGMGIQKG